MWRLNLSQVMSTTDRATESNNLIADTSQEQSYDISPYKVSDDENDEEEEEDDDDDEPNSKFIPSWARYVTQFQLKMFSTVCSIKPVFDSW